MSPVDATDSAFVIVKNGSCGCCPACVSSVDGDYIFLNGNVAGLETKYQRGGKTIISNGNAQIDATLDPLTYKLSVVPVLVIAT